MSNLISIIVPNYNHATFLRERLDSIFNQTYQNFEVILLDDCSSDDSVKILKEYSENEKVSHFVVNEVNSGSPFKQWYKGISLAKGSWIWIAESDDVADEKFLEVLSQRIKTNTGLVYTRSLSIDDRSKVNSSYYWPDELDPQKWREDYSNNGMEEVCSSLIYRNTIPNASGCLFNKKYIPRIGDVENYKFAGDWYFWVFLLKQCNLEFVAKPLNKFRSHSGTSRTSKSKELELKRIKEYFSVIQFSLKGCSAERKLNYENYTWIFSELRKKKKKLGMHYYFPGLPLHFLKHYYQFMLRK